MADHPIAFLLTVFLCLALGFYAGICASKGFDRGMKNRESHNALYESRMPR